jgi:predicted amidohydrolase
MNALRVHYLQAALRWEDFPANRTQLDQQLTTITGDTDLIVLPEMFGSGFTMQPRRVAQTMSGPAVTWMLETARRRQAAVMGSLVIEDDGKYYNRLICADADGSIQYYDKRHLFTFAGEEKEYTAGQHHLLVTVNGWRILPLICYDLRFPVWCRNIFPYDVLVFVANWPKPRIEAWTALLKGRAIENQCYVIGVNRVGEDPGGNIYTGQSGVYDMGGTAIRVSGDQEEVGHVVLDYQALVDYRKRFAFLPDRDHFTIRS